MIGAMAFGQLQDEGAVQPKRRMIYVKSTDDLELGFDPEGGFEPLNSPPQYLDALLSRTLGRTQRARQGIAILVQGM